MNNLSYKEDGRRYLVQPCVQKLVQSLQELQQLMELQTCGLLWSSLDQTTLDEIGTALEIDMQCWPALLQRMDRHR